MDGRISVINTIMKKLRRRDSDDREMVLSDTFGNNAHNDASNAEGKLLMFHCILRTAVEPGSFHLQLPSYFCTSGVRWFA